MNSNAIHWITEDNIGYLILASPPKNEMDSRFFKAFHAIISDIESTSSLTGIVIRSEGRHFSSGASVDELFSMVDPSADALPRFFAKNSEAFSTLNNLQIPVIACITGICYGSGLELALCANFRLASPDALLCLPETGFGIMPGLGGTYNSRKCMGHAKALEFVLTGQSLSSEEALEHGLVDLIRDKKELTETAIKLVSLTSDHYRKALKPIYLRKFARFT